MDLFSEISSDVGEAAFSGNFLDKSLMQFCFINLIQVKINECFNSIFKSLQKLSLMTFKSNELDWKFYCYTV